MPPDAKALQPADRALSMTSALQTYFPNDSGPVLGRFRLTQGDIPITIPPRLRKPQELLQALIALGGIEVGASAI